MYLSQAYMRNKTAGQKASLYLLSYLDAYRLHESDLAMTIGALQNQLNTIRTGFNSPDVERLAQFNELFVIEDDVLQVKKERLADLCQLLRPLQF
jgi:hypothetical protein